MHGRKSVLAFLVYRALSSWPVKIYTDIVLCCLSCRWVHIDVSTGGDPCPISTSHPVSADGSCQRMQQQVAAVRLACRWEARSLFGGSCICRQLTTCHLAAVCFRSRPASHMHTLRVDIDISTTSPQSSRQHALTASLCVSDRPVASPVRVDIDIGTTRYPHGNMHSVHLCLSHLTIT
jgi:hypothetical protein